MVTAIMIVEMMGRPPEHLRTELENHIGKLEAVKTFTIQRKMFSDPRLLDEKTQIYTVFSEVEFTVPTLADLMNVIFDFMPASIEIVDPPALRFNLEEATSLMNILTGRLHRYDELAKIMKNRENRLLQELGYARKLLVENKVIDEKGTVLKPLPTAAHEKNKAVSTHTSKTKKAKAVKKTPAKKPTMKKKKK